MTQPLTPVACSRCNLRELCLPSGLSESELQALDALVVTRRRVQRRDTLFRRGDRFSALFAIRTGMFKTRVATGDGRDQLTGFSMAGEIVGLDGIVEGRHRCDVIALEDSEVCVMPFDQVEALAREIPSLQRHVHQMLSGEIVREHDMMLLLGHMRADERLAAFLLNLVQRLHARGFSRTDVVLRMTREDMGNYLGLKLETVSRTLSKFAQDGLIAVKQRHLRILDAQALQARISLAPCL